MAKRHDDRPRTRKAGAGRPRRVPRNSDLPVIEEIVGHAGRLFARQGLASTTMAEIADAAGLGVSSIYYYFRSKNEIVERIVGDVNRVPLEALESARAVHADVPTQMYAFVLADAAALCSFPYDINEIHRLAADDDSDAFDQYWAERNRLIETVEALVGEGIAAGDLRRVDARLAALTLLANDEAAQNWYRPVGARRMTSARSPDGVTPAAVGAFLADLALRGLLVDPSRIESIHDALGVSD